MNNLSFVTCLYTIPEFFQHVHTDSGDEGHFLVWYSWNVKLTFLNSLCRGAQNSNLYSNFPTSFYNFNVSHTNVFTLTSTSQYTHIKRQSKCKLHHRSTLWIIIYQICAFYVYPSTEPHYRQQFLTCDILYSSLFYQLTGILTKNIWITVQWSWYTVNIFVFLYLPPWRWTHEWPKHVGCHYIIKLHAWNQSALVGLLNKFYTSK
jgi:hypothetical protein